MAGSSSGACQQLLNRFGHSEFRSKEQKGAVECLLQGGTDIYVSMPTGSGKSLVYQLPALAAQGKVAFTFWLKVQKVNHGPSRWPLLSAPSSRWSRTRWSTSPEETLFPSRSTPSWGREIARGCSTILGRDHRRQSCFTSRQNSAGMVGMENAYYYTNAP